MWENTSSVSRKKSILDGIWRITIGDFSREYIFRFNLTVCLIIKISYNTHKETALQVYIPEHFSKICGISIKSNRN
jgi:hypothetical protein